MAWFTGIAMVVNVVLAVAAALGWKHASKVKKGLNSVLGGVEKVVTTLSVKEEKAAKATLKATNLLNGVEDFVHKQLQKLGLAKK